jgi:hypothetical protein
MSLSIASFPAMCTPRMPSGSRAEWPFAVPGPEAITKVWEGSIRPAFKDDTFEIVETMLLSLAVGPLVGCRPRVTLIQRMTRL